MPIRERCAGERAPACFLRRGQIGGPNERVSPFLRQLLRNTASRFAFSTHGKAKTNALNRTAVFFYPRIVGRRGQDTLATATMRATWVAYSASCSPGSKGGRTPEVVARAAGVCLRTARKWLARFKAEGAAGLADRSSPHRLRRPTSLDCVNEIIALCRQRLCGKHIAKRVGVSPAIVGRILRRGALSRMRDLDPVEPVRPL
jgi:leucine-zipper of insertion element IS481